MFQQCSRCNFSVNKLNFGWNFFTRQTGWKDSGFWPGKREGEKLLVLFCFKVQIVKFEQILCNHLESKLFYFTLKWLWNLLFVFSIKIWLCSVKNTCVENIFEGFFKITDLSHEMFQCLEREKMCINYSGFEFMARIAFSIDMNIAKDLAF